MIKINFEDTYDPTEVSTDLSSVTFYSVDLDKGPVVIKVAIEPLEDPLLPKVFNLAFGPINEHGNIDDTAKVRHENISKMFSTVLIIALFFLEQYPDSHIGLDGSNDVRAYLYHRMFRANRYLLGEFFDAVGLDWYVRLLRNNEIERDEEGFAYFKPRPEPFDYQRPDIDLYRYYMFNLKQ